MLQIRGEVALTPEQTKVLEVVTRTASALSAVGVITIITTFFLSRHFRNPMHRLIFINAFFNAFDVTCTMTSVSGPAAGNPSALCQFQGFLNQMFPVADVMWTLAMAIDVFLIVFYSYDAASLKRLEWKYMVGITTLTFIPAFVFLFINTEEKGPFYGSVTIWCAIAPKWVLFRIVIYYVPIWSMILIIIVLYCLIGIEIVKRRRALASITTSSQVVFMDDVVMPTVEIDVCESYSNPHNTVAMTVEFDVHSHPRKGSTSRSGDESLLLTSTSKCCAATSQHITTPHRSSLSFRQYILMPLFFFLALLSVWVAPSTNRVASFIDPTFSSFPLLLAVGTSGSLRGFWNGLVFITIGMKSRKRTKDLEGMAMHRSS
ncbi:hypothetical protein B0H67DRAFT_480881 [Lasiosphaeris hirsuta]|uniref:Glucose receptor Git3-like N-terminal domain-containing protein n=1 Tax=Lasiosphaeris hirsuta TaxID=260670 RepID=A0AA40AZJ9_9PEZI|nr:hypothetical protein B0H67DRAFT_480881 [Lasiosphaeris hirsuta]